MEHLVYFADRAVRFTEATPDGGWQIVTAAHDGLFRDKILKNLESSNMVAVVSDDIESVFKDFAREFTQVEAAGGVVVDSEGRWLMIHRNGRWDLPKGHLERGETLDECATREILEETGVEGEVIRPLCDTWHAYYFPKTARWELKRTHWFELRVKMSLHPKPQTEEGIDLVAWCTPAVAAEHFRTAFPTVRCVAEAMHR